ncbi:MAG: hypothetical protein IJI50_08000 [Ruminococcus sp.]|nr:hypothetical protein [Ruminococcus sp.]
MDSNTDVTLTQTQTDSQRETYTFLGWYSDGDYISTLASCNFTVTADKTVEARYTTNPTKGSYKFSYIDRYGATKIKTVSVALNGAELAGYSGNGQKAGVPTYLWNTSDDAKALFNHDPLLTASLTVTGHEGVEGETEQDDVSAYKKDIVWDFDDSTKRTVDETTSSVTIEATTTPVTFTFKYVINNGTVTEGATKVPYGKVVTFNPLYQNSNYCYIEKDIPSDGFSYWSSDPEGKNILTTNRTFGMLLRGGSAVEQEDGTLVVTAYAQYGKDVPENKWLPEIEEATLTRTIADGEDLTYADYMTNYFNYDGIAVQDMLKDSQYNGKIKYGILVVKSKSDLTTTKLTKDQMKNALNSMQDLDGTKDAYTPYCASAALNSSRTRIAYRYEYDDAAHISNFNRTLYTLYGNEEKMNGYTFTAMAYITFDGGENYECSEVNTELVVANTPSANQ